MKRRLRPQLAHIRQSNEAAGAKILSKLGKAAVLALVMLLACGANDDENGSGGGTGGSSGQATGGFGPDGSPDSMGSGGGLIIPDSSTDLLNPNPYLDAGEDQWCAPEPGPGGVTGCCDGIPCNGGCLSIDGGKVCDCFGLAGGCPQDRVCCLVKMSCQVTGSCQLGY